MAGGDEHVAERAEVVELEAAVDCPDPLYAPAPEALVPAALDANLFDVVEELVDGRVLAVEPAFDERDRALAPERGADRETGEGARRAVAVAL